MGKLFLLFCISKGYLVKEQVLFSFQKVSSIWENCIGKQCPMFSWDRLSYYTWMKLSNAVDSWNQSVNLYLAVVPFSCTSDQ